MKILIGCEESQAVTKEFRRLGHEAYSCDLQPCSGGCPGWHIQDDILNALQATVGHLNFFGCHPVCTFLANSGVRWLASIKPKPGFEWSEKYQIFINPERFKEMEAAAIFFKTMLQYVKAVGKGYLENPIMHKYAMEIIGESPTQIIQPWQFGHTTTKATCLWLVGLPKLIPTEIILKEKRTQDIWLCSPGPERQKIRSKTFPGIAKAMAEQWTVKEHSMPVQQELFKTT